MAKALILLLLLSSFAFGQAIPTGTKGNGTTDDTKALTTWLNAAAEIHLPKGKYLVASQILSIIKRTNLKITAHPEAVIIAAPSYSSTGGGIIQITGTDHVDIEGLTVVGNSTTTKTLDPYNNNAYSIWVLNAESVKVKECRFTQQPKGAIRTDNCKRVEWIGNYTETENYSCDIVNASSVFADRNISYGNGLYQHKTNSLGGRQMVNMYFKNSTNITATNNQLYNNRGTPMKSDGCDNVLFEGNYVDGFGKDGLKIQNSPEKATIKNATLRGNTVKNRRHWMWDGSCYLQISNCEGYLIDGNTSEGDGMAGYPGMEYGIFILTTVQGFATKGGVVSNNKIKNMGSYSIVASARTSNLIISNPIIIDYGTLIPNGHGIFIDGTSINVSILNPSISNTNLPKLTAAHAIQATGSNFAVQGGNLRNIGGKGIQYKPSSGQFANITGITIDNTASNAIYIAYVNGDSGIVTVDNMKINNGTYSRNCLTSDLRAVEVYTGNTSNVLDINLLQFANNNVSKGGTSKTVDALGYYNDGFGSIKTLDYRDNSVGVGVNATPLNGMKTAIKKSQ